MEKNGFFSNLIAHEEPASYEEPSRAAEETLEPPAIEGEVAQETEHGIQAEEITSLFPQQEKIDQLVPIEEIEEEDLTVIEPSRGLNFISKLIKVNKTEALGLSMQREMIHRLEVMNKLLFSIAIGVGVIVLVTTVIMINSFITNRGIKRIEELIAEAEISAKVSYTPEEVLEFGLSIKEELNQINYNDSVMPKVYAQAQGTYTFNGINYTPKVVYTRTGQVFPISLEMIQTSETTFTITSEDAKHVLVPGEYEIVVDVEKNGASGSVAQNFTWGVLAINTHKSVYTPGELVKLYFAVLNERGQMECDADVNLEIISPAGETTYLSTTDGSIIVNESCHIKDVVRKSDFESQYSVDELGTYQMNLSATTENGTHSITDSINVVDYVSMDVERITATRIFPQEDYPVIFKITANEAFEGTINEYMHERFKPVEPSAEVLELFTEDSTIEYDFYDSETILKDDVRRLTWEVDWEAGETHYLAYGYDAPDLSPDYYTLGELRAEATVEGNNFREYRKWQIAVDAVSAFRVTEYYLTTGDFTGTTYDLTLDNDLADDYFVLIRGSKDGDGTSDPDNDYARVYEVPNGTGELADSGSSNVIALSRYVADHDWEGVVTVVETIADTDQAGFELLDIVETSISASSASGTDTSGTSWSDINDVVLFGGFHGGGAEFESAAGNSDDGNAVETRLYPSSTATINWERNSGEDLSAVTLTTFVVEWGSEWTIQRENLSGSASGDGCNIASEYGSATLTTTVDRADTWVWATGNSSDPGIGDNMASTLVTLGDGQNQNTTENEVSYCGEYSHTKDIDAYTMTHDDLAVDYRFKTDGDTNSLDLAVTVDTATDGSRFGWVTNGVNGSGSAHPRDRFWARYTADDEVTISRGHDGQAFPAWVQGIDFEAIEANVPVTVQNHFRWRDDSTDLNSSGGWEAAEDTNITDVSAGTSLRLRLEVANGGGAVESGSRTYELEWGELGANPTCGAVSTWTGVADASDEIDMFTTTHIDPDGEATTTGLLANSETYTFTNGEGRETADITGAIGPMSSSYYTELEFAITPTASAAAGETYCFKVTDAGTDIDLYDEYPSLTIKADTVSIGEIGSVVTDGSGTTVTFLNQYENPVVVAESITVGDTRPAAAMITAIDGTGFSVRIEQTSSESGNHGNETVTWMVMEEGSWTLEDGTQADAGTATMASTDYWNGGTAVDCNFNQAFLSAPAVFTSLQTNNNSGFFNSAAYNTTTSDFDCYIHIEDGGSTPTSGEDMGWIAFDQGTGTNGSVDYEFGETAVDLNGYTEAWYDLNFTQSFSSAPYFITTRNSGNGGDEGWLRYDNLTSVDVDVYIEENDDSDRSHGTSDSGFYAAFDSTGDITARISYDQAAYRWFQNADSLDVGATMAAQDTAVNLDTNSDTARLRMLIDIGVQTLRRYGQAFKLQYAEESGTCDSVFSGETYADITTSTPIAYYDNSTPSDGGTLTDNSNDPSDGDTVVNQTYEEANNFENTVDEVEATEDAMWDFSLVDFDASADTTYCIRAVLEDGTTLGSYSTIPEITVTGINISGTAYTDDDEATPLTGVDVCAAVGNTFDASDCDTTNGSGVFDIINVPADSVEGEQITLFVDGANNGNVVTASNTTDMTSVVLYQDHILTRYETGSDLSIVDMDAYDNDQNAADILFDAEDSSPDTLSWEAGSELYIPSGYTFTPGGNTNGHDIEIDGTWTAASGETINVDGSFKLDTGGTFNESTSTLTFDATSGTENLNTDGTGDLYNLVIDDGGGGSLVVEVEDPLTVTNNLTITDGSLDVVSGEDNQINVQGDWTNDDIFIERTGTIVFDGGADATIDSGCSNEATCTNENFNIVNIEKSEDASVTLSNNHLRLTDQLYVLTGVFDQGNQNVQAEGSTAIEIKDFGRYRSTNTGNLTLGGDIDNDGEITINANGMTCGDADSITIASTNTSNRTWSGSGGFRVADVTASYQTGSAVIYASSSTDSGNNAGDWQFVPCLEVEIEGLDIEGVDIN